MSHHHHDTTPASKEEAIALLAYMIDHNRHHAEELLDISDAFDSEIQERIHKAADAISASTDDLQVILDEIRGKQ